MHVLRTTTAMGMAIALSAGLASVALAADEPEASPMSVDVVEGVTWLLTSQTVEGQTVDVPDGVVVSLVMEGGRAGGNGGCNGYFTDYQLDGSSLTFGTIGSTMMACLPPVMTVEQAYFGNLAAVASFAPTGGTLELMDADGQTILSFAPAPEATVVGSWVATGINNQAGQDVGAVVTSAATEQVTAEFSPDGELAGFDGCNHYFTSYTVDGDTIAISPEIAQTMMACADDDASQTSQWYLSALTKATTWSIDASGVLELRDADGALQVSYQPAS